MLVTKSFFFFLISLPVFACTFRSDVNVGLYSGAMTELIKELSLESSNGIAFYSNYFPIKNKKAVELKGGIFLSKKRLNKFDINTVFYDDSSDLEKIFKSVGVKNLEVIKTSGKTPFKILDENIFTLKKYVQNCDQTIEKLLKRVAKIKNQKLLQDKIIFFLGELRKDKLPDLIMLHDGFVEFLLKEKGLESYDSELAYVTWSERKMKSYLESYTLIGLNAKEVDYEIKTISPLKYNIYSKNALSPGLGQIFFLEKFLKK